MKKILLIPFLFVCYLGMGQSSTPALIIGKPITIDKIIVAQHDFPNMMNWDQAKTACLKLGEGWRLPNKEELNILWRNKAKIGGFAPKYYWSGTDEPGVAWKQGFTYWTQALSHKTVKYHVRAVKSL